MKIVDNFVFRLRKVWMGVAIIIVAAILNEVISLGTYLYTKYTVGEQTEERVRQDLQELERINNLKARVESAVIATVGAVEEFRGDTKRIDDAVMVAIRAI
jgi:hypothetical protein